MAFNILHCSCGANVNEFSEERFAELGSLPILNIVSPVSNIPHLSNVDLDMPSDTNFGYYTPHDFHSSNNITEYLSTHMAFSAMHCNIRSLSANHDNLIHMLSELNHSFPLTGLSETKISHAKDLLVNAGGVAFYIKKDFKHIIRTEFTKSTHEFEALWLETDFHNQRGIMWNNL